MRIQDFQTQQKPHVEEKGHSANENAGFPGTTKKPDVTEVQHNADEAFALLYFCITKVLLQGASCQYKEILFYIQRVTLI